VSLFVDSDNALGSRFGDVDDAFAIAALLLAGAPVAAISAVAGNTSERRAFENNGALARLSGYGGPLLRGREVPEFLAAAPGIRVLALGPLTNVATALLAGARPSEVVIVGGNATSRRRRPHEFNLTKDRKATIDTFRSGVPLTVFPLDVARRLTATAADLAALPGPVGAYLARGSRRWFLRLRLLKATGVFPIYDLAAAMYALDAGVFTMEAAAADVRADGRLRFDRGTRRITVCRAFDGDRLWSTFVPLFQSPPSRHY
jgi:inosine-uridine nucleoside N-ribohydrolase